MFEGDHLSANVDGSHKSLRAVWQGWQLADSREFGHRNLDLTWSQRPNLILDTPVTVYAAVQVDKGPLETCTFVEVTASVEGQRLTCTTAHPVLLVENKSKH